MIRLMNTATFAALLLASAASSFSIAPRNYARTIHVLPTRKVMNLHSSGDGKTDQSSEEEIVPVSKEDEIKSTPASSSSKRSMLKFALPALGIYLCNPLLSNIDNSFVGRTVGTSGLAALSPATICVDQTLYLGSFLSRAATGLVSRAYGTDRNAEKAREAAAAPFTAALVLGVLMTAMFAVATPRMLQALNVDASLVGQASSYIYWRGAVSWAAMAQTVALSMFLATRDAVTPLVIVVGTALLNVLGDTALCVWPLRWGCAGAAAATAMATLVSCGWLLKGLHRKNILPRIKIPTKEEAKSLFEFTGPLLAITITRMVGLVSMQTAAIKLGVIPLAAYQLCINISAFFFLFGEPLSQLSQTQLPALLDAAQRDQDKEKNLASARETFQSVLTLGAGASVAIGSVAALALRFGSSLFTSDIAVQTAAAAVSPMIFANVATTVFAICVDGAMLASRDFKFMLGQGLVSMVLQLALLRRCTSLSHVFATFVLRLGSYAAVALFRTMYLGRGPLGEAFRSSSSKKT